MNSRAAGSTIAGPRIPIRMARPGLTSMLVTFAVQTALCGPLWAHDSNDASQGSSQTSIANLEPFADPAGTVATFNVNGRINTKGAFFQSLGTNGRSCGTCHVADQAMSISPPQIRERFEQTNGLDPMFAPVDGANCTNVKRNDPDGHSLLLKHGLIRVAETLPPTPEFAISVVRDPTAARWWRIPKRGC